MTPDERDDLTLALALIALAGFVDAVGFLILGDLFVSFMSGNSTHFAIAAGRAAFSGQAWGPAAAAGALVGLFVAGVMAGRGIANGAPRWRRPAILSVEAILLGMAAWVPLPALAAGSLLTVAMGAQNGILHAAGRTKTPLTYVTGSLVKFGEALADALIGAGQASAPWPYLAQWLGMIVGGVTGAVAYGTLGVHALTLPALAVALLAAATWARGGA